MFGFISLFCPSLISLVITNKLLKESLSFDSIIRYFIYCLINNSLTSLLFVLLLKAKYDLISCLNLYPIMNLKYIGIAVIISILSSLAVVIIKKNVGFEIEIKNK